MENEVLNLHTASRRHLRVAAKVPSARRIYVEGIIVVGVMMLVALMAGPARWLPVCSAFSSPGLLLPPSARLLRRLKEVAMVRRSTSTAAPPVSGDPRQGRLGPGARGNRIRISWSLGRAAGVICGGVGDGNDGGDESGVFDDGDEQEDGTSDEDDDLPMFSLAAVEDELQSRSAAKIAAPGGNFVEGERADDDSGWWPRFFPPQLAGQEDEDAIQPLVELPLDGILLQLFPALLIGVVGLFLTIAIQVEANRFDGMVGDEGGAVIVTDLRDTTTEQQP